MNRSPFLRSLMRTEKLFYACILCMDRDGVHQVRFTSYKLCDECAMDRPMEIFAPFDGSEISVEVVE